MDVQYVLETLKQKSILITGSTGFLAKIFVEKVLRVQPDVKQLYLLVRAEDNVGAVHRFQKEVIGKDLFRVLREKQGKSFDSFVSEKVTPFAGNICYENLGVNDSGLREQMWREVQIVINVAATTAFDERYDVALGINTTGIKRVLEFAKKCPKFEMLLQVSTAYVSGVKPEIIPEKTLQLGEALNGHPGLDIETELKVVEERLKELRAEGVTGKEERILMKHLGMKRSRMFGWPNTYVFTKALGEMILGQFREKVPVTILRPSIITSTYREPFPGWIEGTRTIDAVMAVYASGKLSCFPVDRNLTVDVIPGDMVVNSMLVSMAAHLNRTADFPYHIGSSVRHPMQYSLIERCSNRYFTDHPQIGSDGKPIFPREVPLFTDMESFRRFMTIRYKLPLQGLDLLNTICCQYFDRLYTRLSRQYNYVMRLVDIYEPYVFFKGRFDDWNTERLRLMVKAGSAEKEMLSFDPKEIDWESYFMNVHIPGVVRYVF
ncbi:fatty acyl-CoA reductase 3-like [Aristolochia californica]|uniref:fatty acyl-CoA reductase 3-like n=1 Tax=Aristolochia californica TaxID=171875 RepID=UPI0035D81786